MNRARGKVTDRGQVTIPKRIRERLGIRPGEFLEFEEAEGGQIVARKAVDRAAVDAAYGVLSPFESTDELLERLRGKPDAI